MKDESHEVGTPIPGLAAISSDSGSNIFKACKTINCLRMPCFGHVLNLAVSKGLNDHRVTKALPAAHKVCAHFPHSSIKNQALRDAQAELKLPLRKLKNDVDTRFVSEFASKV